MLHHDKFEDILAAQTHSQHQNRHIVPHSPSPPSHTRTHYRDAIGDNCMVGDTRWGGVWGVDVDFTALENCKLCTFGQEVILVCRARIYYEQKY